MEGLVRWLSVIVLTHSSFQWNLCQHYDIWQLLCKWNKSIIYLFSFIEFFDHSTAGSLIKFIHVFAHSFILSLIPFSCSFICSFTHLLSHSFTRSFICSLVHFYLLSCIHFFPYSFVASNLCSFHTSAIHSGIRRLYRNRLDRGHPPGARHRKSSRDFPHPPLNRPAWRRAHGNRRTWATDRLAAWKRPQTTYPPHLQRKSFNHCQSINWLVDWFL